NLLLKVHRSSVKESWHRACRLEGNSAHHSPRFDSLDFDAKEAGDDEFLMVSHDDEQARALGSAVDPREPGNDAPRRAVRPAGARAEPCARVLHPRWVPKQRHDHAAKRERAV